MRSKKMRGKFSKYVAFPKALVIPHRAELARRGVAIRFVSAGFGGDLYPACVVKRQHVRPVMETIGLAGRPTSRERALVGKEALDFVSVKNGRIRMHVNDLDSADEKTRHILPAAIDGYSPLLLDFSRRLGGLTVHFHCGSGRRVEPKDEPDAIHIYTASSPPGETDTEIGTKIFGLPLLRDMDLTALIKPTAGRGIVLYDDDFVPAVQLVGRTVYFLAPTITPYHGTVSKLIFGNLLALTLNGLARRKRTDSRISRTRAAFKKEVDRHARYMSSQFHAHQKDVEDRIARLQKELLGKLRLLQDFAEGTTLYDSPGYLRKARAALWRDLNALRADPDVRRCFFVGGGIHVETKRVVVAYNGRRYDTGRFFIRFGANSKVSIWNERSTHPRGIPHPHVSLESGPCFGSATLAIGKAVAELRYYDAFRDVIVWLRNGYSHAVAAVKITEWPELGKGKRK